VVSGCSQERVANGRWNGNAVIAVDAVEKADTEEVPSSSPSDQRNPEVAQARVAEQDAAPVASVELHANELKTEETVEKADAFTEYFQAEQTVHAALRERALAKVRILIAEHEQKIPLFEQGPELQWHPSLGVVSARERTIRYDTSALTAHIRTTGDPERPFVISVMVPCLIYGRSGKGVAVDGELPKPTEALIGELPLPTRRTDVTSLPAELRAHVDVALKSCAAAESVNETVQAGVNLAYERASDSVVLVYGRGGDSETPDK
jgi:hypothetical protein